MRAPTGTGILFLHSFDVVILGAGAAGLMAAIESGRRGRSVLLLEKSAKPAEKIRIYGGGRCNFTNLHCSPATFLSQNPLFCVSAPTRHTPRHFLKPRTASCWETW